LKCRFRDPNFKNFAGRRKPLEHDLGIYVYDLSEDIMSTILQQTTIIVCVAREEFGDLLTICQKPSKKGSVGLARGII
jgi:hypothetical protein